MKLIRIWFWQLVKYFIKKDYGADCETSDLEDFPGEGFPRCPSCKAKEMIDFIDEHISLIKEFD